MDERKEHNQIRITAGGKERHYLGYAMGLLLEKGASARLLASLPLALRMRDARKIPG